MLSHTLAFYRSSQVSSDPAILELIIAIGLKRLVSRSLAPKWSLLCFMWSLTKLPYEPLDQASLQFLTWKTVFLLTLASAKRRSEIHALLVEMSHLRFDSSDDSVTLCVSQDSLPKINSPLWLPNHSRSKVFQRLLDKTMRIDFSAQSGS